MIISPPLLKNQGAAQSDDDWIDGLMPVQNASDEFPVLDTLAWHGGYHLHHIDDTPLGNPLRAIADGIIVYARPSSGPTEVEPIGYQGKADDGCVVIQHTTEIGDGVDVTYYSIYMHLKKSAALEAAIQAGKKVYRKQEIGAVGQAKGQNMIHMEIICDQENLVKLTGRGTTKLDVSTDGRSTVVYGDIHFYLKSGTKFYATANTSGTVSYTSTEDLFVALCFDKGTAILTTRKETALGNGVYESVGDVPQTVSDYEYKLYKKATDLAAATPAPHTPASAIYELLRFGRILDTNTESSDISHIKHLHKVNFPSGVGYVDLNADGVKKFSDGDFPHWMGWAFIDDDPSDDSQCNSPTITKWLDTNGDGKNTHDEMAAALGLTQTKKRLSKTICNFPTEWDGTKIDDQYSWLKTASDANLEPLTEEDYIKFKAHVLALSFWDKMQAPAGGVALPPNKHWHFHPREFIKHFRKCGWLSWQEIEQIYKPLALGNNPLHPPTSSAISAYQAVIKKNSTPFNRMARKYALNTRKRLPHILGQGGIESAYMKTMQEVAMPGVAVNGEVRPPPHTALNPQSELNETNFGHWWGEEPSERVDWYRSKKFNSNGGFIASSYNWRGGNLGDPDAQKFRGRGFKQLTGRDNYVHYWVYRGWILASSFDEGWWNDPQYHAKNEAGMTKRAGVVNNPEAVTTTPYNCMDSGGWYMTFQRPTVNKAMDADFNYLAATPTDKLKEKETSRAVTHAINGGYIGDVFRLNATRAAKHILLDF